MRGAIRHAERAKQLNDFTGLQYGNITPTDIDGVIDYKDRAMVFLEIKFSGAPLPFGQRLALERLVKNNEKAGKHSIAIVADHDITDTSRQVPAAECIVREYYVAPNTKWLIPRAPMTAREMIDMFLDLV